VALNKKEAKSSPPPKKAPKKEKAEDALGGFDLDSVLASTSTGRPTASSAPSERKSSVVATESAQEMDRMSVQESTPSSLPASVGQQRRSTPPNAGATNPPEQESKKPPVRRRAVKKAKSVEQQAPEAEPEPTAAQHDEDEDFSDFSF
jgi:hypothetical protein